MTIFFIKLCQCCSVVPCLPSRYIYCCYIVKLLMCQISCIVYLRYCWVLYFCCHFKLILPCFTSIFIFAGAVDTSFAELFNFLYNFFAFSMCLPPMPDTMECHPDVRYPLIFRMSNKTDRRKINLKINVNFFLADRHSIFSADASYIKNNNKKNNIKKPRPYLPTYTRISYEYFLLLLILNCEMTTETTSIMCGMYTRAYNN